MDAVLLAAGLGTRLRPHTLDDAQAAVAGARPADPRLDARGAAETGGSGRRGNALSRRASGASICVGNRIFKEWATVPQGDPRGTGDALRKCRDADSLG